MIVCDKCGKTVMYVTLLWFSNFIDGLLLTEHADSTHAHAQPFPSNTNGNEKKAAAVRE